MKRHLITNIIALVFVGASIPAMAQYCSVGGSPNPCVGQNVTYYIQGGSCSSNPLVSGSSSQRTITSISNSSVSVTWNVTGSFYVDFGACGCTSGSSQKNITVNNGTANGGTVSSSQSVCSTSELSSLTVSGTQGTIQWQRKTISGGTWANIGSTFVQASSLLIGYSYRTKATNNCGVVDYSNTVNISSTPNTPNPNVSPGIVSNCSWASVTAISAVSTSSATHYYYNSSNVLLATKTATYITSNVYRSEYLPSGVSPSNATFKVSALESGKCVSSKITATYLDPGDTSSPPSSVEVRNSSGVSITSLTVCSGSSTTLYSGVVGGSQGSPTYKWFPPGGGSPVGTSSSYTGTLSEGIYLLEVTWNSNCGGSTIHQANITIGYYSAPNGGTVSTSQSVCDAGELNNLTVSGTSGTIQWQRKTTSGGSWANISSSLVQAGNLLMGYSYRTKATNTCGVIDYSNTVDIIQKLTTNAPSGAGTSGSCGWAGVGPISLSINANSQPTIYYYEESYYTEGQHQSSFQPNWITGTLYNYSFTPPTSPSATNKDFYFRALESGGCYSSMLTVTYATPASAPIPPTGVEFRNASDQVISSLTVCESPPTTVKGAVLGGGAGTVTYTIKDPYSVVISTTDTYTGPMTTGLYTVTAAWSSSCGGSWNNTATLNVTANTMPNAGTDGTDFVCSLGSSTISNLEAMRGAADSGGNWTDDHSSGVSLTNPANVDFTGVTAGNYDFTYTLVNGLCQATSVVTVTVGVPASTPAISAASSNPVCNSVVLTSTITAPSYEWYQDGVLIGGENQANYTALADGNYSVVIIDSCPSQPSAVYNVQLATNPDQKSVSLTGPSLLCNTEATSLLVTSSQAGIEYRVKDQSGEISDIFTGNGNDLTLSTHSLFPTLINPVYIEALDPVTGCTTVLSSSYTLSVDLCTKPEIRNTGVTELPTGQSTTLEVLGTYSTYQWRKDGSDISGATGFSHTANQKGIYSAEVTYSNGSTELTPLIRLSELEAKPDGSSTPLVSISAPAPGTAAEMNYVKSHVAREALDDANFGTFIGTKEKVSTSIQYFDGLGRTSQTVSRQGSPGGLDIIQPVAYDPYGRVEKEYLPYISGTTTSGDYQSNALLDQYNFYQQSNDNIANSQATFAWSKFEDGPLNIVTERSAPGDAWYPGPDFNEPDRKTIKMETRPNQVALDGNILIWEVFNSDQIENSGTYLKGEVMVSSTTDEHGSRVQEFIDKVGRTILKRVENIDEDSEALERWLETYYVYDDRGNLRFVLPPEATKAIHENGYTILGPIAEGWEWLDYDMIANKYLGKSYLVKSGKSVTLGSGFDFSATNEKTFQVKVGTPDEAVLDLWAFQYQYDGRNRMIAKKVPGADWVYMIYDKWDRLVLTQDGNQRLSDTWIYTKYDHLNRPIITGEVTITGSQSEVQALVDSFYQGVTELQSESYEDLSNYHQYTNTTYPANASNEVLSVTYYDHYDFNFAEANAFDPGSAYDSKQPEVAGQVTGSKTRILGGTDYIEMVTYYDDRYRALQSITENSVDGIDVMNNQYDFIGNIEVTSLVHSKLGENDISILQEYTYDHGNRLLEVTHQVDGATPVTLVSNEYNELGELVNKDLHIEGASDPKQSVDYQYNIRGWLTHINNSALTVETGDVVPDLFGMELYYDHGYGQSQYNGNIAGVKWQNGLDTKLRSYGYVYDPLNRIKFSDYYAHNGIDWLDEANRFNMRVNAYDLNGNILGMEREGETDDGVFGSIDDMDYAYSGNKLISVEDAIGDMQGRGDFYDGVSQSDEYHYDANGNMIKDRNKGIEEIDYNHLNLPNHVDMGDNNYIEYVYDASGIKLQQKVFEAGVLTKTRDYTGPFIYEDDELSMIQHEEGRILPGPVPGSGDWEYQYHLKDHLGNARVTFTSEEKEFTYLATMESEDFSVESSLFSNMLPTQEVVNLLADYDPPAGNEVYLTNEVTPIGPALMLQVAKGDQLNLEVYGYFDGGSGFSNTLPVATMNTLLTTMFTDIKNTTEIPGTVNDIVNDIFGNNFGAIGSGGPDNVPAAYLNYLAFDKEMNLISENSGYVGISSAANGAPEPLSYAFTPGHTGFVLVYVSNESNSSTSSNAVFWDDLRVVHTQTPIVQVDDYYPFGLTFNGWQRMGVLENKFKFQGQEHQTDLDLNWYSFKWRNHQPDIGRFFNVDPLAEDYYYNSPFAFSENKVISFRELEGLEATPSIQNCPDCQPKVDGTKRFFDSIGKFGKNAENSARYEINRRLDVVSTNLAAMGNGITLLVKEGFQETYSTTSENNPDFRGIELDENWGIASKEKIRRTPTRERREEIAKNSIVFSLDIAPSIKPNEPILDWIVKLLMGVGSDVVIDKAVHENGKRESNNNGSNDENTGNEDEENNEQN